MPDPVFIYRPSAQLSAQKKIGNILLLSLAAVLLAGVPIFYSTGAISITTVNQLGRFLAMVIAAIGLDLVWGYTGILSLCQAMFFCLGGYAIGMYMALHGPLDGDGIPRCLFVVTSEVSGFQLPWFWLPFKTFPFALILGILIPGLFAYGFGYFTFRSRVRGVYFSIITQATTIMGLNVFRMNNLRLCGTNGLTNFVTLAGFDLQSTSVKLGLYLLTTIGLIAAYLVGLSVVRSRLGRVLVAVRDNESRLRFAGFQPVTFKVFVFALGAMMAALGGMLYVPQNGIITPYKMEANESILIVAAVAVGGRGTLSGAVVGSLVVSYLQSLLTSGVFYGWLPAFLRIQEGVAQVGMMGALRRALHNVLGAEGWLLILGLVFIVVTLFLPEGIVGAWRRMLSHKRNELKVAIEADKSSSDQEQGSQRVASYDLVSTPMEEHV
jgi:urea transport system permease protein